MTRDRVEARVRDLTDHRRDEIRGDPALLQLRLASLLPGLADEFEGVRSAGGVRACAEAILDQLDEASVRSYELPLGEGRVRGCLRAEQCDPLVGAR